MEVHNMRTPIDSCAKLKKYRFSWRYKKKMYHFTLKQINIQYENQN